MHDTPHKTLFQFFHSYLEDLHSLPLHIRKILMVVSMVFASTFVGVFSWLLFSPLQNLSLPSFDTNQQAINYNQALDNLNKVAHDNELGDVSKIVEIGPASGFMESFKAMKDLIVPKNISNNPLGYMRIPSSWHISLSWPQLWPKQLSSASGGMTSKLHELFRLVFERLQKLQEYVSGIAASSVLYVVSHLSMILSYLWHIISRITGAISYALSRASYALSYASYAPSILSHILDLVISSMSRTAM